MSDVEHYAERKQELRDAGFVVYSASQLGSCIKAQAAVRMGFESIRRMPEKILAAMEAGSAIEEVVVAHYLHNLSVEIYDQQQEILLDPIPTYDRQVVILGHIDGKTDTLLVNGMLVEIKSMSQAEFDKFKDTLWDTPGLIQKYKWQISAYMVALGTPCRVIVVNRDAEDHEKDNAYVDLILEKPFYSYQDIYERVVEIETIVEDGVLPIECSSNDYPCPVFFLHADPSDWIDNDEKREKVEKLAAEYLLAASMESKGKLAKQKIRDSLLKELGTDDQKVSAGDGVTVTVYQYKRSGGLDEEKMKEDGIKVEKYRKPGSSSPTIRVTGPKD